MRLVVDTSFFIKWFITEDGSSIASDLRSRWTRDSVEIIVPSLAVAETSNILLKHVSDGVASFDYALAVLSELPRFVRIIESSLDHSKRALALAH